MNKDLERGIEETMEVFREKWDPNLFKSFFPNYPQNQTSGE